MLAQDFGSRLPLVACGDSFTPAKRLKFESQGCSTAAPVAIRMGINRLYEVSSLIGFIPGKHVEYYPIEYSGHKLCDVPQPCHKYSCS